MGGKERGLCEKSWDLFEKKSFARWPRRTVNARNWFSFSEQMTQTCWKWIEATVVIISLKNRLRLRWEKCKRSAFRLRLSVVCDARKRKKKRRNEIRTFVPARHFRISANRNLNPSFSGFFPGVSGRPQAANGRPTLAALGGRQDSFSKFEKLESELNAIKNGETSATSG